MRHGLDMDTGSTLSVVTRPLRHFAGRLCSLLQPSFPIIEKAWQRDPCPSMRVWRPCRLQERCCCKRVHQAPCRPRHRCASLWTITRRDPFTVRIAETSLCYSVHHSTDSPVLPTTCLPPCRAFKSIVQKDRFERLLFPPAIYNNGPCAGKSTNFTLFVHHASSSLLQVLAALWRS